MARDAPCRYRDLCKGFVPQGTPKDKKKAKESMFALKNAMYHVKKAEVLKDGRTPTCTKCEVNKENFVCYGCKTFAHDGICPHVLAVTHIDMRTSTRDEQVLSSNVAYMTKSIGGKRNRGRINPATKALEPTDKMTKVQRRKLKTNNRRRVRKTAEAAARAEEGGTPVEERWDVSHDPDSEYYEEQQEEAFGEGDHMAGYNF